MPEPVQFEKKIEMSPARDYGDSIHGVDMLFTLKGPLGAVCFQLSTNWQLPHVRAKTHQETLRNARNGVTSEFSDLTHSKLSLCALQCRYDPLPVSRSYHSLAPRYEGQEQSGPCSVLDGKPCYSSASYTNAAQIFESLLSEGLDGVWKELEYYYHDALETPIEQRTVEGLELKESLMLALHFIAEANKSKEDL